MAESTDWGSPLWSSGQSSWLQIQRFGFDSRRYQIFWEVVDLERGPLSLVSTTEELLEGKSSGSGLENRERGRGDPLRWPRDTLCQQTLTLRSSTSGGSSVGIVRSRTQATELLLLLFCPQTETGSSNWVRLSSKPSSLHWTPRRCSCRCSRTQFSSKHTASWKGNDRMLKQIE
jgi:hypothetical protein